MSGDSAQSLNDLDRPTRDEIVEIINEVESEVLAEDKLGAGRDMMVEGTCERIRERIYSRFTEPEGDGRKPGINDAVEAQAFADEQTQQAEKRGRDHARR